MPIPAGFREQIGPHVVTPKISAWNEFPAAAVSHEAGSVIYKGDSQSYNNKMRDFNQVAWDKWGESCTRWQDTFVSGNRCHQKKKKKERLESQLQTEKVAEDLKSSTLNGKLTFKEDLGNIQSSFQVEMMSLGRHGKTRWGWWWWWWCWWYKKRKRRKRSKSCPGQLIKKWNVAYTQYSHKSKLH